MMLSVKNHFEASLVEVFGGNRPSNIYLDKCEKRIFVCMQMIIFSYYYDYWWKNSHLHLEDACLK